MTSRYQGWGWQPTEPDAPTYSQDVFFNPIEITLPGDKGEVPVNVKNLKLYKSGALFFTKNCNIENMHVLAADSVCAAPGVQVHVDNLIVIGYGTLISNIEVDNLMVPADACQKAKDSYKLLKPVSMREMPREEVEGWGKDLFGAEFKSIKVISDSGSSDSDDTTGNGPSPTPSQPGDDY